MKKILILILIIVPLTAVLGQENRLDLGLEGSPSLIFLYGNKILQKEQPLGLGFSGGISCQYNFPKYLSIRTNIAFERKGYEYRNTISYTDQYGNVLGTDRLIVHSHFDYLTMPILLRATIGKKIKYFFNTGPYIGYLVKVTDIDEATIFSPKRISDITNHFICFDFGITNGIGILIPIVPDKLIFSMEIRNNTGLINISALPVADNKSIKTNSTNYLLGLTYKMWTRQEKKKL